MSLKKDMTEISEQNNAAKKIPFWKKKGFITFVCVFIAPYLIYKLFYPTYSWNERMIVTVSTPDGDVSGSAVRSVKIVQTPRILPQITGGSIALKGEAVVIDLGNGKHMFALLGAPAGWAGSAYGVHINEPRAAFTPWARWTSYLSGQWPLDLPRPRYPTLVTFDDLDDPSSIKKVNPERLYESFGEGYKLKSIKMDISFDWVTKGKVKELLGWLGPYPEPGLCKATGQSSNIPFCRKIKPSPEIAPKCRGSSCSVRWISLTDAL